jgi:hypothetical protein
MKFADAVGVVVTFVLACLFFSEDRLKCKGKSWCLNVEIADFPAALSKFGKGGA